MTCSDCQAAAVTPGQRYCHICGAMLLEGTGAAGTTGAPATTLYTVGDGSDRAMSALTRQLTLNWLQANKGRLVLYGGGAAVALVVAVTLVIAVIAFIAGLVALLAPFALALLVLYAIARPRRRRRRLARIYRF